MWAKNVRRVLECHDIRRPPNLPPMDVIHVMRWLNLDYSHEVQRHALPGNVELLLQNSVYCDMWRRRASARATTTA